MYYKLHFKPETSDQADRETCTLKCHYLCKARGAVIIIIVIIPVTSGAGTANSSAAPEFTLGFQWGSCYSVFSLLCMFCRSLVVTFLLDSSVTFVFIHDMVHVYAISKTNVNRQHFIILTPEFSTVTCTLNIYSILIVISLATD
jgi:hypothetical protein